MFYKSIRFKISIVYMAMLAATLSLFSVILHHYMSRGLYENMDALLSSKAEGIVSAINTYWTTEKLGRMRYGGQAEDAKEGLKETASFTTVAQKWVESRSKDPKLLDIIVQIFDADGVPIASSKNTQGISSVSRESLISVLQGKSSFDMVRPSFPTKKAVTFRVFITPAIENDKVEYIVQVASPTTSIQTALYTLKVTIFILFPATVLLTGVMGAFLAKLSLHPVDSMIDAIHGITAENMKLRISIPGTKDELQKLAETFNDMLQRLDNAFTTQKQLFEDLSHELKTPLTILRGEFEVALKRARSCEEYEAILKSSLEEIDKITKLVEGLLMLASFESKKIAPERKRLDLNLLIRGVINNINMLAERKKIEICLTAGSPAAMVGDEKQLKQLFLNLIDNAVKYTPPNGRVDIRIEKEEGFEKIIIKDTGQGIPEKDLPHIFDRFYRAGKSEGPRGFGLGLSIAKSIVNTHKGTIDVVSQPGQGATFRVRLPIDHTTPGVSRPGHTGCGMVRIF